MSSRRKVVILGVDGADFALYRRWIGAGLTPSFADLAARGRLGILQSTYPPVTAPAWTSLITGEQPGSHGLVGFTTRHDDDSGYLRSVVNSGSVEAPFLWEIAGSRGTSCCVVNVPMTYPIRPVNGILVSGLLTPSGVGFTHPPEFERELRRIRPDYRLDLLWQDYEGRGLDLVRDQKAVSEARAALGLALLEREWDFFMLVFTGTDRIQHCLHEHVARIHDDDAVRSDPLTAAVRDYFVTLDGWIGELVQAAGPDANVLVVSDHGFGPLRKIVQFNRWLADEGLLTLRSPGASRSRAAFKRVLNAVGVRRSTLVAAGRALGLGRGAESRIEMLNPHLGGIDWSRTSAYYVASNGFVVNLKGREASGTVEPGDYESVREDLIRRLEALKDPETGKRLVPVVKRREEIFAGRRFEAMPDVFIEFLDEPYEAFTADYDSESFLVPPGWSDGTHRRNGLYIGAGPGLAQGGDVKELEIFDIAPNVLHLMGHAIPRHMDGRFRPDLFRGDAAGDPTFEDVEGMRSSREGITDEQRRELEKQLEGLGYL